MPVISITNGIYSKALTIAGEQKNATGFSRVFTDLVENIRTEASEAGSLEDLAPQKSSGQSYIELGKISKETPTVSHILKNHPAYSDRCWEIIHSLENQAKEFTKMPDGTVVALKADSDEVIWGKELSSLINETTAESAIKEVDPKGQSDKTIELGTISKDNPTVSHLFQSRSDFDSDFWNIINSPVNSNKQYNSLRPGTRVSLDSRTKEISFNNNSELKSNFEIAKILGPEDDLDNFKVKYNTLADAVKPFIGKDYRNIDCFGLVARGLINQGVNFHGHGGLREKLEDLALRDGLPANSYLNGEGLVEHAGTMVFSKSMYNIYNPEKKADEIFFEMMPYLKEGHILSFSTPTQGHTGIISRNRNDWTYINSGRIDNQVAPGSVPEGVAEEYLKAEIRNWSTLASSRKESLIVSMGQIDADKLKNLNVLKEENKLFAIIRPDEPV